jgi:hypothetical protein
MKEVKNLYNKNYKTMKKTLEDGRPPMVMDQNLYCENRYTTESDLYIQCNSYENFSDVPCRSKKVNPKIHMK